MTRPDPAADGSAGGGAGGPGRELLPADIAELVGELSEETSPERQRRLANRLAAAVARGGRVGWAGVQAGSRAGWDRVRSGGQTGWAGLRSGWAGLQLSGRWLTDQAVAMAPRLPVRSQQRLREQFPGLSPDELADALIVGASRASASVGAAVGAALLLPLPSAPVEVAAEVLALVGIEIKLVAELHEVYGARAPGPPAERMLAYLGSWSQRRGVSLVPGGVALAMGSPLRGRLQRRLLARAGRGAVSLGPLFTGAAAGALLNRRETRRLGAEIRDDLQRRSANGPAWPR
jgi:hypothetical protein